MVVVVGHRLVVEVASCYIDVQLLNYCDSYSDLKNYFDWGIVSQFDCTRIMVFFVSENLENSWRRTLLV